MENEKKTEAELLAEKLLLNRKNMGLTPQNRLHRISAGLTKLSWMPARQNGKRLPTLWKWFKNKGISLLNRVKPTSQGKKSIITTVGRP